MSVLTAVQELDECYSPDLPAAAKAELLVDIERASRRLEALRCRVIGDFDAEGGASLDGSASTAAWLRNHCQLTPADAHGRVRTARALRALASSLTRV